MQKLQILQRICDVGLVAVVRAQSGDEAVRIAEAVQDGGCNAMEITFTVPRAHRVIEELAQRFSPDEMIVGAGTVLDPETARIAILSGAQYVVSPSLNTETVKLCNRYQIPVMAGATTVKEIIEAMETGSDIIKLFPGEMFGPQMIKTLRGPLPQAPLMPTGGVDLNNVAQWIENGAVAVGVGGNLTTSAKNGDYHQITQTTKEFIDRIADARNN
jgi:2-dehydro-3-deoxyphosphogluconate aldolase / (4S)-4-hydroxy-2-oxoglutarate aldolase